VAHVERARDIRRRHGDDIGVAGRVGVRVVEAFALPRLLPALLDAARGVERLELHHEPILARSVDRLVGWLIGWGRRAGVRPERGKRVSSGSDYDPSMPKPIRPRSEFPTPLFTATLPLLLAAAVALAVLMLR
jgi:hypothetical protein